MPPTLKNTLLIHGNSVLYTDNHEPSLRLLSKFNFGGDVNEILCLRVVYC